jgi:iron(III) transport system ATP-binding protein
MEVRVQDLARHYGTTIVLKGVSFTVPDGNRTAILGPSGSGKTTLLRLVAGLDLPDGGTVAMGGEVVSRPGWGVPPHERHIGFVFQFPALWPHMTVLDNVCFGLTGVARAEAKARAADWLARVQLEGLGGRYPDQLSGGQAQRVSLARALAPAPALLLMDEPLAHVDAALKRQLLELILALVVAPGVTLLYVTHDPEEADALAEQQLRLHDGALVED